MALGTDVSSRRAFLATAGTTLSFVLAGCLGDSSTEEWQRDRSIAVASAVQYQVPTCECCSEYATYLDDHLDGDLETVKTDDVEAHKREIGVPSELESCHTVVLDDQYVEGHVPVEAIDALLEDSNLAGVAIPGMPRNSPGMGPPGDSLEVYGVSPEGEYDVFTTV